MAEDQRRGTTLVVAGEGVHVGAADPHMPDLDHHLAFGRRGVGDLAQLELSGGSVDQGLHFAVYPPSTKRI